MITDKLINVTKYADAIPYAEEMLAFAKRAAEEKLPAGRYDIIGDDLYALVQEYTTKTRAEARMESHKLYIDLQYVLEGEEIIYWSAVEDLKVEEDRTPESDLIFYECEEPQGSTCLGAGMFGFYLPTDGHMPSVAAKECAPARKIVFKIRCK